MYIYQRGSWSCFLYFGCLGFNDVYLTQRRLERLAVFRIVRMMFIYHRGSWSCSLYFEWSAVERKEYRWLCLQFHYICQLDMVRI